MERDSTRTRTTFERVTLTLTRTLTGTLTRTLIHAGG